MNKTQKKHPGRVRFQDAIITELLVSEYQQFASNVVKYYHKDLSKELPNIPIPGKNINRNKQNYSLHSSGSDPAADKFNQFRNYG